MARPRLPIRTVPAAAALLFGVMGAARADTHYVTVVNAAGAVMDGIRFTPAGVSAQGDNRLRSTLPPNAEARIAMSSACSIDIRVSYVGGAADERLNVDACGDPRVTFLAPGASPDAAPPLPASAGGAATPDSAGGPATPVVAERPLAPRPVPVDVPPAKRWDGHSLTKRLGLDGWVDP